MRKIYPARRNTKDWAQKIALGGTGAGTAEAAGDALNMVQTSQNLKPHGIILLNESALLTKSAMPGEVGDPSIASLIGVFRVGVGQSTTFTISNYDDFIEYTVTATLGTVVRRTDEIIFTAGAKSGAASLVINGREYGIVIDIPIPVTPSIVAPSSNSTLTTLRVSAESSAFSVPMNADTHLSSDWELATDSEFKSLVSSVYDSLIYLTSWSVADLSPKTKFYIRARHRGAQLGVSDWSLVSSFTTGLASRFEQRNKIVSSDGVVNDSFGVSVALSADGSLALIGAYADDDKASDAGSVYVFTQAGGVWTQQQKLLASDGAAGDWFGVSVALSADGSLALIGANNDNDTYNYSGSVYVFTRSGTTWTQQQKLHASDPATSDYFGVSVALNADATYALIGAHGDDDTATDTGSVYVFTRIGTVWAQQQKLHASDAATGDLFGCGVALSADATFALIGARSDDDTAADSGSAYIFTRSGTTWTQQTKLHASDAAASDCFGVSVALNADASIAMVGAHADDAPYLDNGSVYVFTRVGTVWTQQQKLIPHDSAASDYFGVGVAMSSAGSLSLIGAMGDDDKGSGSGSVYSFEMTPQLFSEAGKFYSSDSGASDLFGNGVAMNAAGDYAIVGAPYADFAGDSAGAAYVFTRTGSVWTQQQRFVAPDTKIGNGFGSDVALSPDGLFALIGSAGHSNGSFACGAVYFYSRTGDVWTSIQKFYSPTPKANVYFGISVAMSVDMTVALVGAYNDTSTLQSEGMVYYFTRTTGNWVYKSAFMVGGQLNANFGVDLDVNFDASVAIIGATGITGAGTDSGAAYIYTRVGDVWTQQKKIVAPDAVAGSKFGGGVAISNDGTKILISATLDATKNTGAGAVYEFGRDGAAISFKKKFFASDGATGTNTAFGRRIALTADGLSALISRTGAAGVVAGTGVVYYYK